MSYLCSEYLEFHQTELDKLTTQLKDMKRNSRLVGPSDHEDANTGWRVESLLLAYQRWGGVGRRGALKENRYK